MSCTSSQGSLFRCALLVGLAAAGALASGCSDETAAGAARAAPRVASRVERRPLAPSRPRAMDVNAIRLRAAIDAGRLTEARELLASLRRELGVEGTLLAARVCALEGRPVDSGRLIEEARAVAPDDPRVYATAAELHAAAGRFKTAWAEVRRGEEACGDDRPELVRARGVAWICREGGAQEGVELLEHAFHADPLLPFLDRPLGQGYLLLAKGALAEGLATRALHCVERSLEHDPQDVDARRLAADVRAGLADFEGAIVLLDELLIEGEPVQSELALMHKRAGMAALIASDREGALRAFLEARRLGLSDDELGTGAQVLASEASLLIDRGVAAIEAGLPETAAVEFELALRFDPDRLEAQNHLGVVQYRLGRLEGAIEAWRHVVRVAWEEGIELPDPVHMNLATALLKNGDRAGARDVLQAYLVRSPEGEWSKATRERLARLADEMGAGG